MAIPYNSQLDAFELYHKVQKPPGKGTFSLDGPALPALGHAVAGSTGAAISNVCTYPLDLIITRLQIQRQFRKDSSSPDSEEYKDVVDAAYKIYETEGGLPGFYAGVGQDTSKTIADAFLFFLSYNFLRQQRLRLAEADTKSLPALEELTVGFLAGSFTKLLTTPIANIVTRKQTSALVSSRTSTSDSSNLNSTASTTKEIASHIHAEKGIRGFWSGYSASLILTLNPSLTFFLYETFKRLLLPRSKRDNPPPTATFFIAAISKAIASSITYPFSLAKSRAQASSKSVKGSSNEQAKEEKADITGSKEPTGKQHSTIFTTVHHIARTDGIPALYEGLSAEVLKGFFSHGITMIIKESIHRFIIKMYYVILIALRKYPTPEELMERAKTHAEEFATVAKENAMEASGKVAGAGRMVAEAGQKAAQIVKENVADGLEKGRLGMKGVFSSANETAELVADYVEEEAEEWRSLYSRDWHGDGDGEV